MSPAGSSVWMSGIKASLRACAISCVVFLLPACVVANSFSGIDRVVAISDVHGAYDSMVRTLSNAGVIDADLNWSGGETHLVITGDLLDRGADSRPVMDLVMRLEGEAQDSGGQVHLLLGNHEVMNLIGDLRYVANEEFAAFADDESAEERERWWQHFMSGHPDYADETELRAQFDKLAPPGYFGHRQAFSANGNYGKWLLEKPLIVVVNRTAFVHGGLPPLVAELGLDGINEQLGSQARTYTTQMNLLNDAGLLNPIVRFYEQPESISGFPDDPERAENIRSAMAAIVDLADASINNSNGPLWYRGTVGCGPLIESDRIDAALAALGADRVVIGHTPTITRQVLRRLDGRVIEIDTGMLYSSYKGVGNALLMEGDDTSVVNEVSGADAKIVEHPRRVGMRSDALGAGSLGELLANGEIVATRTDLAKRTFVDFSANGETITAEFIENPRSKGFVPELAAYQLDLLLELGMVPVTIEREIDGDRGVLQFVPRGLSNEAERSASGKGSSAWCPLQLQWPAMYVWDALVYNPGRMPQNILYSTDNWQLILNAHQQSFANKRGRPAWLEQAQLDINGGWVSALSALTDEQLQQHLGTSLDKRRLAALVKRRDKLLEQAQ